MLTRPCALTPKHISVEHARHRTGLAPVLLLFLVADVSARDPRRLGKAVNHHTCESWCNEWLCNDPRGVCAGCGPEKGCFRPAAPPGPPGGCSGYFKDCSHSRCCLEESQSCFGRNSKHFSQCRPTIEMSTCGRSVVWDCPKGGGGMLPPPLPPPPPTLPMSPPPLPPPPNAPCVLVASYGKCWHGYDGEPLGCCHKSGDICSKRRGKSVAMCIPHIVIYGCKLATSVWECPGWDIKAPHPPRPPMPPLLPPPPQPPHAPPPPPVIPSPVQPYTEGIHPFNNCWDRLRRVPLRCKSSPAKRFACFKKEGKSYAQVQ